MLFDIGGVPLRLKQWIPEQGWLQRGREVQKETARDAVRIDRETYFSVSINGECRTRYSSLRKVIRPDIP
jgi:hypothetical protein